MVDTYFREAWSNLTRSGAPYEWSVVDIGGNPTRAYNNAPATLRDVWRGAVAAFGDREYLVYGDERRTYAEVQDDVQALMNYLHGAGVGHGHRVAIAMRNYPEWIIAYWATVSLGAVVVGMNAWWTAHELKYGLEDSSPKILIVDTERLERVRPFLDEVKAAGLQRVVAVRHEGETAPDGIGWSEAIAEGASSPACPEANIATDDDLCIFYTSGTTGFPKGAVMTHRGASTNLLNLAFWPAMAGEARKLEVIAAGESPRPAAPPAPMVTLLAVPLFHVTGCNCSMLPTTAAGGTFILMYKWNPGEALRCIEAEGVTNFTGVPVMSRELIESPAFTDHDVSTLTGLGGGGAPVQPDLVTKIEKGLSKSAPSTGYGLTETNGVITVNSGRFFVAKPTTVGPALPVMEARIVDETGTDLPPGELGELWVRGANNVRGYYNRPEATAEAFTDGWFHTGDIAFIDEDEFITIADRAKDMVLRGGENIYCAEVEAAIFSHDGVRECAVFAVPDDRLGEVPGVAIVLKDGVDLTSDQIQTYTAERIAKFKVPERVWFLDEQLPRNANGKFLKRELREQLLGS